MDCLMMEKAALIMAWLATHAAAVAKTNTNCTPQRACQDLCMRYMLHPTSLVQYINLCTAAVVKCLT